MRRAAYHRYLASREWGLLKEQVRQRSGGHCEHCGSNTYEQTHHVTYERVGAERLDDLLAVCEECHLFLSGKSDDDPSDSGWCGNPLTVLKETPANVECAAWICSCGEKAMRVDGPVWQSSTELVIHALCGKGHKNTLWLFWGNGILVVSAENERRPRPEAIESAARSIYRKAIDLSSVEGEVSR